MQALQYFEKAIQLEDLSYSLNLSAELVLSLS